MSQPSVASFFNTRKRTAIDDGGILHKTRRLTEDTDVVDNLSNQNDEIAQFKALGTATGVRTRSGRLVKRTGLQNPADVVLPKKLAKFEQATDKKQRIIAEFIKKGPLSPRKKTSPIKSEIAATPKSKTNNDIQKINEATPSISTLLQTSCPPQNNALNMQLGMRTPTKQIIKGSGNTPLKHTGAEILNMVKKELNFDEVKTKVSRSAKLKELKASLSRIQELEKTRKAQEENNRRLRENLLSPCKKSPVTATMQLKKFDKIELEVLTSPVKTFKTPTKLPPPTPDKNELMSPRHTDISKRVLFSPSKNGSPSKLIMPPAYQRFQSLIETSKAGLLPLPYKYRNLIDVFRAVDSVCAMFHNRRECITFKKLKPAVQRMLRKNFNETHLAQIKQVYPEAYNFTQMKMRNYGSTSKADYFQLVISPNVENVEEHALNMVKIDEDNVLGAAQTQSMNPHVMTERLQHFQLTLLQRVRDEHDKFLKSLDPPLGIAKEKVTRWHPDFDLENCSDIEFAHLPQAPNVEKYSSARDILSTARNLFNCATPMERVMERYEAKLEAERTQMENMKNSALTTENSTIVTNTNNKQETDKQIAATKIIKTAAATTDITSQLLKGLPKALLEKVRAKQAAKALDQMTRRPSQDREASKYSRLPELARHLRNVFITERKGVLTLEIVIKKIQNSFRTCLTAAEVEEHLQLIAKEIPEWLSFHEVRKTMYVKIIKDMELKKVIEKLVSVTNEKIK